MKPNDRPTTTARRGDGLLTRRLPGTLRGAARALLRAARALAAVIRECNLAQRRLSQLRLNPDRYYIHNEQAPDSYAEFLYRTSGWLPHEPPAEKRFAARQARR